MRKVGGRDAGYLAAVSLAFLLLVVQVTLVGRYHRPPGGLLGAFAIPGRLLGLGAVTLLALAIFHALFQWWGVARIGSLAVLGTLFLALGTGGLAGVRATPAQAGGGSVAGGLAALLERTVGPVVAGIVLALVAIPGALLALSPVLRRGAARASPDVADPDTVPEAVPPSGPPTKTRAWYPERKVADDGTEIPMSFDGADVGPIRYREPEPAPPSDLPATEAIAGKPPKAKAIRGVRFADEVPPPDEAMIPGVRFRQDDEGRLSAGVRYADADSAAEADSAERPGERPSAVDAEASAAAAAAATESPPQAAPAEAAPGEARTGPARKKPRKEAKPDADPRPSEAPGAKASPDSAERPPRGRGASAGADRTSAPPTAKDHAASDDAVGGESRSSSSARRRRTEPAPDEAPASRAPAVPEAPPSPTPASAAERHGSEGSEGSDDPLYAQAVEAALERGSASLVLLKRRLNVGYARASALVEALVKDGVLGEMTASGSRPALITAEQWAKRKKRR